MIKTLAAAAFSAAALTGAAQTQNALETFAQAPGVTSADLSVDGRWMAVGCLAGDRPAVCLYDLAEGGQPALHTLPDGLDLNRLYFPGPDHLMLEGEFFQTLPTQSGPRDYRFLRAVSFNLETGEAAAFLNSVENVTDNRHVVSLDASDPGVVLAEITLLTGGEREAGDLVQARQRLQSVLYRVNLDTGAGRRLEVDAIDSRIVSPDGEVLAHVLFDGETGAYGVRRVQGARAMLYEGSHPVSRPYFEGFTASGDLVFTFPESAHRGVRVIDLETGAMSPLHPDTDGRIFSPILDPHDRTVVGYAGYLDDRDHQFFLDERLASDAAALSGALGAPVEILSWSADRSMLTLKAFGETRPDTFYLYERHAGALSPVGEAYPGVAAAALAPVRRFDFTASDGLEIPGFLTTPPGLDAGAAPLVVLAHGGPHARDDLSFDWWAQAYAAAGYAVLQTNYRGSSGYGDAYMAAGFGEFGGRMIDDLVEGAQAAQAAGLARPGPVCFAGASYGGYAALMAAIRRPEAAACAVAVNPVTDPVEILGASASADGFGALAFWERYIGDRFMNAEAREAISPLRRAMELGAPTVILHGEEDQIVPVQQSRSLAQVAGGRVRFVELEGTDHYLRTTQARRRVLEESLALFEEAYD